MNRGAAYASAKRVFFCLKISENKIQFQPDFLTVKICFPDFFYWLMNEDVVAIGRRVEGEKDFFEELEEGEFLKVHHGE